MYFYGTIEWRFISTLYSISRNCKAYWFREYDRSQQTKLSTPLLVVQITDSSSWTLLLDNSCNFFMFRYFSESFWDLDQFRVIYLLPRKVFQIQNCVREKMTSYYCTTNCQLSVKEVSNMIVMIPFRWCVLSWKIKRRKIKENVRQRMQFIDLVHLNVQFVLDCLICNKIIFYNNFL